jgi:hypothetical protein
MVEFARFGSVDDASGGIGKSLTVRAFQAIIRAVGKS